MKQEKLNYLTYGSVISISHVQDDHSFITADGFVKRTVFLQNFHHIDLVDNKHVSKMKSRPYYNTLFQIFPKFTNNTKQEILKELQGEEADEETQPAIQNILESISKQQKVDEKTNISKEQIQTYSQKLLQEFKYNLDTFEKSKAHKVSYKSHIQFLHLASSKFLACHQKEARVESSNYRITLDELPSDSSLFKILPAYKYQKEGEQVIYASDIVFIVRATSFMNKLTYLHASMEMGNYGKSQKKHDDIPIPGKNDKDIIKREVNAALDEENQTQWRISVYSDYVAETSGYLKCGDVIWLHHSETNTTIAATRKGKSVDYKNFQQFDLVEWLGVENVELNVISGSTKESYDEYTGDTHSMWIIEAEQYNEGGIVVFDKKYRFKHFASGLYLAGGKDKFSLDKQRSPQTLFLFNQLRNTQSREKCVRRANYVYICQEIMENNENQSYWVDIQKMSPVLHKEEHKTDQSVFKLYVSSSNDVWEISFVLSCVKTLMNYLSDIQKLKWENDANDKEVLKDHLLKIQTTKQCIEDINNFCNNKLYNSTPEQKYGTINKFRQKLLKEQYYIDLLVKILVQQLKPEDLLIWSRRIMIIQMQDIQQQQEKMSNTEQTSKKQGLKDHEMLAYIAFKIIMNQSIYTLLTSICKQNPENEKYTFDLIGHFLEHCRYIPEAIKCMISIIGNNQELLSQLSVNMKIDYNPKEHEFFEPEEERMQVQHHKVPNNFLIFFLNLLETDEQPHKADFLTFLRNMCIYNSQGINQNQEAIYKLLKKHNHKRITIVKDKEDPDKMSLKDGKLMIPFKLQNDPKEMHFINEQLQFYADVSFGRNYLWKQELEEYFSKDFLFTNIWQENENNRNYSVLQAALCKIAMSLYIDHDPLNRVQLPQYCNLFKRIDIIEEKQHKDLYKPLVEDLFKYLQDNRAQIVAALDTKEGGDNNRDYDALERNEEKSLLVNELLYNSCQMMQLVLELDVFTLFDNSNQYYKQIIDIVIHFFFYDFQQLALMKSVYKIQKAEMTQRKQRKENNPLGLGMNLGANLMNMANPMNLNLGLNLFGSDDEQKSDSEDEEQVDEGIVDDVQMYTNPLMRGFIKLENELQSTTINVEDSGSNQLEIKIKLTLCDIMDRFLNMRQNYLMLNILSFFKKSIIEKMDEGIASVKITKENENLFSGYSIEDADKLKLQMFVQKKVDSNLLGLLPNIAKTGLKKVDEKEEKQDAFGIGTLNFLNKLTETKPESEEFKIFTQNVMQIYDLDQYFSLNLPQEEIAKISNPIGVVLPFLFINFSQIHEEELEQRCLAIIMRYFNQREELCSNIYKLQLISDPVKSKLYEYLSDNVLRLNQLIDRSEVWLTDYMKNNKYEDLDETLEIIDNFRQGFFKDTQISARIISSTSEIDPEKQNLMNALKIHVPILSLIRDQLQSLDFHLENSKSVQKKQRLAQLFIFAFQFLTYFCKHNHENQLLLAQNLGCFEFMHIEVGQIPLICEIYKDNQKLLSSINNNERVFHKFVELIYQSGRKQQFLDFFLTIIRQGNKYIFDNQLLVLNTFLEKDQLLYAEKNEKSDRIEFIFEGDVQLQVTDFLTDLANPPPMNQPYRYHTKLLDLLLQCTFISVMEGEQKDNFTINVAKLKKKFTISYLIQLLCAPDSLTTRNPNIHEQGLGIMKKQLWIFFMNVHITSEKSHTVAKDVIHDIIKLIEHEVKRLEHVQLDLPLSKYFDFLAEAVLPLFTIYMIRKNVQPLIEEDDDAHDQEQKDVGNLSYFARCLSDKMLHMGKYMNRKRHVDNFKAFYYFFPSTNMGKCFQQQMEGQGDYFALYSVIQNILSGVNDNLQLDQIEPSVPAQSVILPSSGDIPIPKTIFNNNNEKIKSKISAMQLLSSNKKKEEAPLIEMEVFDVRQDQIEKFTIAWEAFVGQLCFSDKSKAEVQEEMQKLSESIVNFEDYFENSADKPEKNEKILKVEKKFLIKKFINFLSYTLNSNQHNATIITLLCVLRKVIEGKQEEKTEEEAKVEGEDDQILEMQNLFNKLGATRMVLTVLSESTNLDGEMLRNFLLFLNTLLSGGNNKVQKTIFEFMKTYPKSEVIFSRLNNVIQAQIKQITVKAKDKKNEEQQQQNEEPNVQELKQQQELELLLTQVLKFLQNCCEGHYLDLQNYIRQQTNSRNSFNMINQVAELLLTYYYKDKAQYENMVLCLDTLNELVQGPCPENQVAVADSKFFEIASDLFGQRKDKEGSKAQTMASNLKTSKTQVLKVSSMRTSRYQRQNKSTELKRWQIERMQTKCLILILSLIEMREISDQNPIIKRIMRHLTPTLLQKHMVKCFARYEEQCKEGYQIEVLDLIKEDPDNKKEGDQNKEEKDYELILQKGFYIYFLMCYYMESDKNAENQFVQMYRANTRKKLKQDKGTLEDLLFGDNIVGQLVSFVMSLANSWIDMMNYFKKKAMEQIVNQQLTPEQIEKKEREKKAEKSRLIKRAFDFFYKNSASIEVVRNNEIEIVYFILLPNTHNLPKEQKVEFHENVDRSSTKSKVQFLVLESERLIEICEHEEYLRRIFQKQKFLALFANYVKLWKDLAFLFTLLLNLFIIGSFAEDADGNRLTGYRLFRDEQYTVDQTRNIFLICGTIMACCSIFVVSFFLFKNAPLIIKKAWKTKLPLEDKFTYWPIQLIYKIFKLLAVLFYILREIEVVYYLAYGALAVIGTVIHPFFFCFHLTEILIRYPTLKNVVKSVWEPKQQLGLTLILFIILVYVYGLIAYTFFYEDYQGKCQTTLFCFLYTFDWTFKANAGVGGYLSDIEDASVTQKFHVGRYIFDNTSNIILTIIMVNIVAGIIIDTFGSLREKESDKISDIQDKCYICGNLKTTFDRLSDSSSMGGGFDHHIKVNHYMWNFVFFMAYLKYKDPTDYTGIEQYVWEKIQKKDLKWFPFNKARELQGLKSDEEEESKRVEKISADMSNVMEKMKSASQVLNSIKNRKQLQASKTINNVELL